MQQSESEAAQERYSSFLPLRMGKVRAGSTAGAMTTTGVITAGKTAAHRVAGDTAGRPNAFLPATCRRRVSAELGTQAFPLDISRPPTRVTKIDRTHRTSPEPMRRVLWLGW
jgi:hypothetical protein